MSATAQITKILPNGNFTTANGQFFSFHVEFDGNANALYEANAKSAEPRWKVGDTIWYVVTGERQGIKKVKISTQDPNGAVGGAAAGGGAPSRSFAQDPATTKRIENSWAVQTAINIIGPWSPGKVGEDDYLQKVKRMAGRLLSIRDEVVAIDSVPFQNDETPY